MRKWYALKRDWSRWFDLEIEEKPSLVYQIKITSWDNKWQRSYVFEDELDKTIILEDNKEVWNSK